MEASGQMMKTSAHSVQALHSALFLSSSLSCQGAGEGQPVSYCETGSRFLSRCSCASSAVAPEERWLCFPMSSIPVVLGRTVSRACPCLLKMKAHRLVTGFQEVGLRGYGRARFPTSTSSRSFWQPLSQAGAITMSLRARREMRAEARQAGMQSPRH